MITKPYRNELLYICQNKYIKKRLFASCSMKMEPETNTLNKRPYDYLLNHFHSTINQKEKEKVETNIEHIETLIRWTKNQEQAESENRIDKYIKSETIIQQCIILNQETHWTNNTLNEAKQQYNKPDNIDPIRPLTNIFRFLRTITAVVTGMCCSCSVNGGLFSYRFMASSLPSLILLPLPFCFWHF